MLSYDQILSELRQQSLFRELRTIEEIQGPMVKVGEHRLANFASNDYLGLSQHPSVKAAAKAAIDRYGVGSGASRLVTGSQSPHAKFEKEIAAFKATESALLFSTGYAAAVGTICSLIGPGDVIILDKLCHACLIDGAKLSGALLRVFPHNNAKKLKNHLAWAQRTLPQGKVLIATESVFSMDGDCGDLASIVDLKNEFGALLLVDEAHATGVVGPQGSGLVNALGLTQQVDVQMGTLSKALGASGGFICGSQTLIHIVVNAAPQLHLFDRLAVGLRCGRVRGAANSSHRRGRYPALAALEQRFPLDKKSRRFVPPKPGADQCHLSGSDWRRATKPLALFVIPS